MQPAPKDHAPIKDDKDNKAEDKGKSSGKKSNASMDSCDGASDTESDNWLDEDVANNLLNGVEANEAEDGIWEVTQEAFRERLRVIKEGVPLPPKVKQAELPFKPERAGVVFWDEKARCRQYAKQKT